MLEKKIRGILFDLDGVLVSTDEYHYQAWKRLADEEGIPFTRLDNERLRGISRMQSMEIVLEKAEKSYLAEQKTEMAERKNVYYREMIQHLTPQALLPGAADSLSWLKAKNYLIAVASSSKNTQTILERLQLSSSFQAIVDGNSITHSKPNPEVFLTAAKRLGLEPENCLVVEDADAGIEAAKAGGFCSLGIGSAEKNPDAIYHAKDLSCFDWRKIES